MSKRSSQTFQEKLTAFNKLFDVCSCKCYDAGIHERSSCTCPLLMKIPPLEWDFWLDQKSDRRMFIDVVDKETTKKLQSRMKRKQSLHTPCKDELLASAAVSQDSLQDSSNESDDSSNESDDSFVADDVGDHSSDDEHEI